jgi:hypothetical protein
LIEIRIWKTLFLFFFRFVSFLNFFCFVSFLGLGFFSFHFVTFLQIFRFVSILKKIRFFTFFCFKPLKNNLFFIFPLQSFRRLLTQTNSTSDIRIIFRCLNFYLLKEIENHKIIIFFRKIILIGLQKANVRQQSPSNSWANLRKDELHNQKAVPHSSGLPGQGFIFFSFRFIVSS